MRNELIKAHPSLKPCPFCGKPADMLVTPDHKDTYLYTPQCPDTTCPGRNYRKYRSEEDAINKWNNELGKPKGDFIKLTDITNFPIRLSNYDEKNGNINFIYGIESVIEYIESLPRYTIQGENNETNT